jgi:beta-lactamase regulating signal transducer with metallopeptidase domain
MILYFLKTIIILGIFYMLYLFFLKNNKTFKWNRIYLLASSVLALLLPFLNNISLVKKTLIAQPNQPIAITLDTINIYASNIQTKELDFAKIVIGIYAVGFIWGLLRMILGFIVIKRIKESSRLEKVENDLIYFNKNIESPFSFNSNIYIPDSFRNTEVLKIILKHEQAHVQLKHSRDKIYFSILQALCWFNPFIYFYHKEIELVHEFEADEFSTQEFATDDYVENLLKTIQYTQTPTLLAHHFFHHPLKTRITMLYTKSKNALVQKATVIVTGIIICSTLLIIQSYGQKKNTKNDYKYKIVRNSSDTVLVEDPITKEMKTMIVQKVVSDTIIYESVEVEPKFACGKMNLQDFIKDNLDYPKECIEKKIEGKVIMSFVIGKDGFIESYGEENVVDERLIKAAKNLINSFPKWTPAKINGKPVSIEMKLPIVFKL